ncbi:MAG TPA: hypothetical protein VHU80_24365, partial [Polyangiaceae bacterium]|nr:hypothetical protein [Polyangiaceae bacterium]
ELVRMLLDAGANPNGRNDYEETPLILATTNDGQRAIAVTKVLLERGADPSARDVTGDTVLHEGAVHDAIVLIAYYASTGADLNVVNRWGATPLDRAVDARSDRAADLLYRLGAQVATTAKFEPPLLTAARTDDAERTRWLLIFGADGLRTFKGQSALDVARESRSDSALDVLETAARP